MSKTILIVEDDPKSLKLVRDLLQVSGYSTIEATDGKQGIESAKTGKPDLILMDIQMPVMDGKQLYRWLQEKYPRQAERVIFFTGSPSGDVIAFIEKTGRQVITKPCTPEELIAATNKTIEEAKE